MDNETKHTPGPWALHADHAINGGHQIWGDGCLVADVATDANARLIAAAPDLLAALEGCRAALATLSGPRRDLADWHRQNVARLATAEVAARAAIAKATGQA